ncbi:hypothetical protein SLEP1_g1258 [Rubroshorea leprosula]|uniref:Cation efflux protein transmembrane domain-containing protein n=1 Tax=Rubroshorea leprosula TaxID=152421 RepID=A0AAV5HJ45_9ROSI|nr:hypothetical protein SLEP1_g1258 [Rubroshorea leprosula]
MGFRFYNLNPIFRSYLSRVSSARNLRPNPIIHSLNSGLILYHKDSVFSDNPNYLISRRLHLGHSHGPNGQQHHLHQLSNEAEKIFRLGLAADIGLATGKALTGYLSGSTAIIADAAHSISDVVLSGVALLSFKAANTPKDKEHPYGHF